MSATMMTTPTHPAAPDIVERLPELPEPYAVHELWGQNVDVYDARQMRAYAAEAVRAALSERAEAVPAQVVEFFRDFKQHCSEVCDHTDKSFRDGVLKLAARAHKVSAALTAQPAAAPDAVEAGDGPNVRAKAAPSGVGP